MSKTMPVSLSRKLLEEYNNNNNNSNNSSKSASSSFSSCSSSSLSFNSYSSRSISPEPSFDSILSGHSLHRKPTFSYIPIDKRRRSLVFSRSTSFNSISTSVQSLNSSTSTTPESEVPTTPTSLYSSTSDHSVEYTSFPNLEKFDDECWTEIRIEKNDSGCDIEMEPYDEMFVAGVKVHSS